MRRQESEQLKCNFNNLFVARKNCGLSIFVSGPLPTLGLGAERFSPLLNCFHSPSQCLPLPFWSILFIAHCSASHRPRFASAHTTKPNTAVPLTPGLIPGLIEQCSEWQRQLYINFIDFQKAFGSIHRDSLWKIMRTYGIPSNKVDIIEQFYNGFSCSVGTSTTSFEVLSGVHQGCVMSAILFNLAIDWVMRRTIEDKTRNSMDALFHH